jgi:hypothetical protein
MVLTPEEKKAFPDPAKVPDEVSYCTPCLRVMKDRASGAQLLKGLYEMRLRELGVNNAAKLAEAYHKVLLKIPAKRLH